MKIISTEIGLMPNTNEIITQKLQQAIDELHHNGGGTIVLTQGTYLCGTLQIKSNITLELQKDAVLQGIDNVDCYPDIPNTFIDGCGRKLGYSFIYADDCENISIVGGGKIAGAGDYFTGKEKRPFLVRLIRCTNVNINNVTFANSGAWCFHMLECKNVVIDNFKLDNHDVYNADGIDIDSCKNVKVLNSNISSDDDSICLKTTSNTECKNIVISNCIMTSKCSGFKIGTETACDFSNILVENCKIIDAGVCAIKITPTDGGSVKDLVCRNIDIINSTGPIFIATGNRHRSYFGKTANMNESKIENLVFENINITSKRYLREGNDGSLNDFGQGIVICGRQDSIIQNVLFKNVNCQFYGGITENVTRNLEDITVGNTYPECHFLKMLPSYGYYFAYAKNIVMDSCSDTLKNPDARDRMITYNVKNIMQK